MEIKEFEEIFNTYIQELKIKIEKKYVEQFYNYMQLLLEWNEKINLTAITDPKEIIIKHFVDSLTISKYIPQGATLVDMGTGAGFPGIPLKIYRKDIKITLVDSLNKRIRFLNEVIEQLNLEDIETVHARAEEFGRNSKYREAFDIATSRAVANLSTLSEYLVPLVRIKGKCICMKGPDIEEEIQNGKKAIRVLGGNISKVDSFELPNTDIKRTILIVDKVEKTGPKYPRKPGMPAKEPII